MGLIFGTGWPSKVRKPGVTSILPELDEMKVRAACGPTSVVMKASGSLGFLLAKDSSCFFSFWYSASFSPFFSSSFSMWVVPNQVEPIGCTSR